MKNFFAPTTPKKNYLKIWGNTILDLIEKDARKIGVAPLIGLILVASTGQVFPFVSWQFWLFLIGLFILVLSYYFRGEKKRHRTRTTIPRQPVCLPSQSSDCTS